MAEIRSRFESSNRGGRLVKPEEVARVVAWLCSERTAGLQGRHVDIEGAPVEVSD